MWPPRGGPTYKLKNHNSMVKWIPPGWLIHLLLPNLRFSIFPRGLFLDSWRAQSALGFLCYSIKKICPSKIDMSVELLILVFLASHDELCLGFAGDNHQAHHALLLPQRMVTNQFLGLLHCFWPPQSRLCSSHSPHLMSYLPTNPRRKMWDHPPLLP